MKLEIQESRALKKRNNQRTTISNELSRAKIVSQLLDEDLSGKKLLDIGCGLGTCMNLLEKRGAITKGLDIYHKGKKIINFDLNSGKELPFKNKEFDIVICTEVIEHTFYPHFVLKEIKRILKDGVTIISLPNEFNLRNRLLIFMGKHFRDEFVFDSYGHHYFPTENEIRNFIEPEFKIIDESATFLRGKKSRILTIVFKWIRPNLVKENFIMKCQKIYT